jgi:hypothetical protein
MSTSARRLSVISTFPLRATIRILSDSALESCISILVSEGEFIARGRGGIPKVQIIEGGVLEIPQWEVAAHVPVVPTLRVRRWSYKDSQLLIFCLLDLGERARNTTSEHERVESLLREVVKRDRKNPINPRAVITLEHDDEILPLSVLFVLSLHFHDVDTMDTQFT